MPDPWTLNRNPLSLKTMIPYPVLPVNPTRHRRRSSVRRWIASGAVLTGLILAAGCSQDDYSPPPSPAAMERSPDSPTGAEVQRQYQEAFSATGDYAYARKQEFIEAMRVKTHALERRLAELADTAEQAGASIRTESQEMLDDIETRTSALRRTLDNLESATEETWEATRTGAVNAYDGLSERLDRARKWLSERIAP